VATASASHAYPATGLRRALRAAASSWALAAVAVAVAAGLPFARGLLGGESLYFRDLATSFFPVRRFLVLGLLRGELRYWNPYLHEGEPSFLPPLSYPMDLLQLLRPDEAGFSLVLALHIPAAAVAMLALARRLGLCPVAAAGAGLVYALGGFALSMVNLYFYVQAMAWAPLVVLGLLAAAGGGSRAVITAGLAVAIALSTLGLEVAVQAVLFGAILAASARLRPWLNVVAAAALGAGLAGAVLLVLRDAFEGSERARGFTTDVVLSQSVHPLTLVQVVVANFYGDLHDIPRVWWGENFFPRGFPYVISLYLGALTLALAAAGLRSRRPLALRLGLLGAAAALVCLGRWAGLAGVVDFLPVLHVVRYPVKAFFTLHLAAALLVGHGLQWLTDERRAWRFFLAAAVLGALPLLLAPYLPRLFPERFAWFVRGFFPPRFGWERNLGYARAMLADAARGGTAPLAAAAVAVLTLRHVLRPQRAAVVLVALVAADLLRAGAGLNPTVTAGFFRLSPDMSREASLLRAAGRVFSCDPMESRHYLEVTEALARVGRVREMWAFALMQETLSMNIAAGVAVPTAYSADTTMLVPQWRLLPPEEMACRDTARLADRLRRAAVAHVLSVDPLDDPELELRHVVRPARIAPAVIHVYALRGALPGYQVAAEVATVPPQPVPDAAAPTREFQDRGGVLLEDHGPAAPGSVGRVLSVEQAPGRVAALVAADRPTAFVLRSAFAEGWSARLDGRPAAILRADGRHQVVRVPAGQSRIDLRYEPPHLRAGVALSCATALLMAVLWVRGRASAGRRLRPGPG
jgi:hypothetical protein